MEHRQIRNKSNKSNLKQVLEEKFFKKKFQSHLVQYQNAYAKN
jgi:hypothetical protein